MRSNSLKLWAAGGVWLLGAAAGRGQATFAGLGVPPPYVASRVFGISADGTTVVGMLVASFGAPGPDRGFVWRAETGYQEIPPLPGDSRSGATAVSADGSVVMAFSHRIGTELVWVTRWTAATGPVDLQVANVSIRAGSADLSVVAGATPVGGFFWEIGVALTPLGEPSVCSGVSADGRIVLGDQQPNAGLFRIFLPSHNFVYIPPPALGAPWSGGISGDGRVIVGAMELIGDQRPFAWREGTGYQMLPGPSIQWSEPMQSNADGTVLTGASVGPSSHAMVWTLGEPHDLAAVLTSLGATGLAGWSLNSAVRVSASGRVLAGTGLSPEGMSEAWIATLPVGFGCLANCDLSTTPPILNAADFGCFLNRFAAGDPYANCDDSTLPPVLNVADFACFLNTFAAGCS
jgi:uncharacterized membrane protein